MSTAPLSNSNSYRATLVPALHHIQDTFGYLARPELERLAEEAGIPQYRIHEVASFFPHFQLVPPKPVVVRVCRDMACGLNGAAEIINQLQTLLPEQEFTVEGVSCLGRCDRAPAACVLRAGAAHESYYHARSTEDLQAIAQACLNGTLPPADHDVDLPNPMVEAAIDVARDGVTEYAGVLKALAARDASLEAAVQLLKTTKQWPTERAEQFRLGAVRRMPVGAVVDPEVAKAVLAWQTEADWAAGPTLGGWADAFFQELTDADLRGLGGAGIPATQKWKDVRDSVRRARQREEDDRAFIVVNGDESEPGTFKDRELLLRTPHLIVEAVILAGLVTEASQGFIYIRHEYGEQIEACRAAIERAEKLGLCGENASAIGRSYPVSVFVSPGGYICGEQSALIEAMSDRRGEPRNMPPKLETNGLDNLPTLVSNVETFGWVPYIYLKGGKTYAAQGVNGCKGRRFFSVSGDVERPGVYEVPMGLTLRELIMGEQYCRGIAGGRALKAFAPSGPSGGFLPARLTAGKGLPRDLANNKAWQALASRRGLDPTGTEIDILDLELELNVFRALSPTQALGAGLVVYADHRDMAEQASNSLAFFRNESCGKCVPCRLGSQKLASLGANLLHGQITESRWTDDLLPLAKELGKAIEMASICGLGRSVPQPLMTASAFFPDDISKHLVADR